MKQVLWRRRLSSDVNLPEWKMLEALQPRKIRRQPEDLKLRRQPLRKKEKYVLRRLTSRNGGNSKTASHSLLISLKSLPWQRTCAKYMHLLQEVVYEHVIPISSAESMLKRVDPVLLRCVYCCR